MIEIPYQALPEDTLIRLIEEFVTREGTDYGHCESTLSNKVEQVRLQLKRKQTFIQFDEESESCQLITLEEKNRQEQLNS